MTAEPTTEKLARALTESIPGVPETMVQRARAGVYDDYKSQLEFPQLELLNDLALVAPGRPDVREFMQRVIAGEFEGTDEEALAWGRSQKGRTLLRLVLEGSGT